MTLVLQAPFKLDPDKLPSHPAFFLQPCHVSTVSALGGLEKPGAVWG
jgi:hypothetical protein